MATSEYTTVDEYIARYPEEIQVILQKLRETIRAQAPKATEKISWNMPTYHQHQNLIHFAVGKHHIGIYPGADGVAAFLEKLSEYKTSKGAIQLPLSKPIPYELVAEITRYRVASVEEKFES